MLFFLAIPLKSMAELEICTKGETIRQVELTSGQKNNCYIALDGVATYKYKKNISCKKAYKEIVDSLMNVGFICSKIEIDKE